MRGGRAKSTASRSRWKDQDVLDVIRRSRDSGKETLVKGGIARLSFGSDGPGDDDDTLWVWDDEDLLPNGALMVSARKATFDDRWPYTGRRGWRPTSNKLSEAGFHFTPTAEDEDGCTCIYCGVELGGWERTDDPVHEHQRRRPSCPFFHCILANALDSNALSNEQSKPKQSFEGHGIHKDEGDEHDYLESHYNRERKRNKLTDNKKKEEQEEPNHDSERHSRINAEGAMQADDSRTDHEQEAVEYSNNSDGEGDDEDEESEDEDYQEESSFTKQPRRKKLASSQRTASFESHHHTRSAGKSEHSILETHDALSSDARNTNPISDEQSVSNSRTSISSKVSTSASDAELEAGTGTDHGPESNHLQEAHNERASTRENSPLIKPASPALKQHVSVNQRTSLPPASLLPTQVSPTAESEQNAQSSHQGGPESEDEAAVERMVTTTMSHDARTTGPSNPSLPDLQDFLPIPFPHRQSQVPMPPMPDPRKVSVLEWITQQQNYLLDTMRERIEQSLANMRRRNADERKRLEKTMRSS